ncbi:MAG: dihydrodipicolinate synthase family protein, partial [Bryobacteraceae bacterium]
MKLQGIFVDTTTPFDHNGDLYAVKIQHNIEKWNRTSVSGYVIGGWAGEGAHLSATDRESLWTAAAKHAGESKIVIAAVDRTGVQEAAALAARAAERGCGVLLANSPGNLSVAALFFQSLADRSPIPVLIADHVGLPVETIAALSRHPNICGVLEGSGNVEKIKALAAAVSRGFAVLTGSDGTL